MSVRRSALEAALLNPVMADGSFSPAFVRFLNSVISDRKINTGPSQPVTIASGAFTILPNFSAYAVDTQSGASTDDLDTISGGNEGDVIFLSAANSARTVVVKDGTGNIYTNGSADLSLDNTQDVVIAFFQGGIWKADLWNIGA